MPKIENNVENSDLERQLKDNLAKNPTKTAKIREFQEKQAFGLIGNLNHVLVERFTNKKSIKILNLGCGFAADFFVLQTIFAAKNIAIKYVGIENTFFESAIATGALQNFPNASIHYVDGSSPEKINKKGIAYQSFDLIILQHAYLLDNRPNERNCFITMLQKTVPAFLAPGGYVYTSFYTEQECKKFIEISPSLDFCNPEQLPILFQNSAPHHVTTEQGEWKIANYMYVSQAFQPTLTIEQILAKPSLSTSSSCGRYGWFVAGAAVLATAGMAVSMLAQSEETLSSDTLFNP